LRYMEAMIYLNMKNCMPGLKICRGHPHIVKIFILVLIFCSTNVWPKNGPNCTRRGIHRQSKLPKSTHSLKISAHYLKYLALQTGSKFCLNNNFYPCLQGLETQIKLQSPDSQSV
jgi:hypothetical protein